MMDLPGLGIKDAVVRNQIFSFSESYSRIKDLFCQNPRSLLIPGAEQHIVMEEEITEVTQPSTVPIASNKPWWQSSPEALSSPAHKAMQEPSEPHDNPPQSQNWIIEQKRELKWTPSLPSST